MGIGLWELANDDDNGVCFIYLQSPSGNVAGSRHESDAAARTRNSGSSRPDDKQQDQRSIVSTRAAPSGLYFRGTLAEIWAGFVSNI